MTVTIDPEVLRILQPHSEKYGMSVEEVVNNALRSHLRDNPNYEDLSPRAFRAEVLSKRMVENRSKGRVLFRDGTAFLEQSR